MKPKKGKKQESIRSDLAHILGYTGTDMDPVGPPSPAGSEKEAAGRVVVPEHAVTHALPLRLSHPVTQHSPDGVSIDGACTRSEFACTNAQLQPCGNSLVISCPDKLWVGNSSQAGLDGSMHAAFMKAQ